MSIREKVLARLKQLPEAVLEQIIIMTEAKSLCLRCEHVVIGGLFLWCSAAKHIVKASYLDGVCNKFKEKQND